MWGDPTASRPVVGVEGVVISSPLETRVQGPAPPAWPSATAAWRRLAGPAHVARSRKPAHRGGAAPPPHLTRPTPGRGGRLVEGHSVAGWQSAVSTLARNGWWMEGSGSPARAGSGGGGPAVGARRTHHTGVGGWISRGRVLGRPSIDRARPRDAAPATCATFDPPHRAHRGRPAGGIRRTGRRANGSASRWPVFRPQLPLDRGRRCPVGPSRSASGAEGRVNVRLHRGPSDGPATRITDLATRQRHRRYGGSGAQTRASAALGARCLGAGGGRWVGAWPLTFRCGHVGCGRGVRSVVP